MKFADVTAHPVGTVLAIASYGKRDTTLGDRWGMTRAILLDTNAWTPTRGYTARTCGRPARPGDRRTAVAVAVAVDHGRMGWSPAVVNVADVRGTWEEHEAQIPVKQAEAAARDEALDAARARKEARTAAVAAAASEALGRDVPDWTARDLASTSGVVELLGLALAAKRAGLTPAAVGTEVTA